MILIKKVIFFIIFYSLFINSSFSEINFKIIMKINNEIITTYDLEKERNYLLVLNPGLKEIDENKLIEITKRSLIEEIIKKNEILKYKKLDLQNSQIDNFLNNIIQRLNFSNLSELEAYLKKFDISINELKEKIEIQNQWKSLIYAKYSKSVKIDKSKLKKKIDNASKDKFLTEYNLSEIVFANKQNDLLKKLITEIEESIKNVGFENTAGLYSISDSSKIGGKIGWIRGNDLSEEIVDNLKNMEINSHSDPIKVGNNFLILKINEIKKIPFIIDKKKELDKMILNETAKQLEKFSNIFYDKIKLNSKINEF